MMTRSLRTVALLGLSCLVLSNALAAGGFLTTTRGTQFRDLKTGVGESVQIGDVVTMHFVGWLDERGTKGKEIYNSRKEGRPVSFVVGTDRVMQGWSDGVIGMKPGGKRMLKITPTLGYGARGVEGVIPPDSVLMFLIDLIAVEK